MCILHRVCASTGRQWVSAHQDLARAQPALCARRQHSTTGVPACAGSGGGFGGGTRGSAISISRQSRRWQIKIRFEACLGSNMWTSCATGVSPAGNGARRSRTRRSVAPRGCWRPITPTTPSGKKVFLLLVDDCTRFMWVALLRSKDEATEAIKRL
jgi:hypothetical protein